MSDLDISSMVHDFDSEVSFQEKFLNLLSCGTGIIHVRSHEIYRTLKALRKIAIMDNAEYHEWDIRHGFRQFTIENLSETHVEGDGVIQLPEAMGNAWDQFRNWSSRMTEDERNRHYIYTFVNPQFQMTNNPLVLQQFIEYCEHLPASSVHCVMVTNDMPLPADLSDYAVTIDYELPGHGELREKLDNILRELEDEDILDVTEQDRVRIAIAGAGMSGFEFELAVSRAIIETTNQFDEDGNQIGDGIVTAEDLIAGVQVAKTEIIRKNDLLELMKAGDINNVGGLDNLKDWIQMRSHCYSDEFKAFGGEPPKGLVVVGVPGSGKSLLAKAVGGVLGIPIVRLDFSKVFNALVGSSEERMRTALKMVEAMSPCVLFVDEIDKGLGGLGGSGDSGTSMRVFGTFLTWLNDCTKPVFTMVTANNIGGLPPELLRRGRFDDIFSTTLPTEWEREDVLAIHLRIRGHDIAAFTEDEIAEFRKVTDAYVPAEIEAIVKDGLVLAFNENPDDPVLRMDHLIDVAKQMVPLSKSHSTAIASMVKWAQDNARPASLTEAEMASRRGKARTVNKSTGNVRQLGVAKKSSSRRRRPTK